jgi:hypothetical protein
MLSPIGEWVREGQGFTVDVTVTHGTKGMAPGTALVEVTADGSDIGVTARVALVVGANGSVILQLTDVNNATGAPEDCPIETDPMCTAALSDASTAPHHVAVVVDAGPMTATWIVDGIVCDGGHYGPEWSAGWFWLPPLAGFGRCACC